VPAHRLKSPLFAAPQLKALIGLLTIVLCRFVKGSLITMPDQGRDAIPNIKVTPLNVVACTSGFILGLWMRRPSFSAKNSQSFDSLVC